MLSCPVLAAAMNKLRMGGADYLIIIYPLPWMEINNNNPRLEEP